MQPFTVPTKERMSTPEILYFSYKGLDGLRIGIRGKNLWDVRGHIWQWTDNGLTCSFLGPDGSLTPSDFQFIPSQVLKTSKYMHPDEFALYQISDEYLERIIHLKRDIRSCKEEAIFYTKKAIECMEEAVSCEKEQDMCEEVLASRQRNADEMYLNRVWDERIY